MIKKLLCFLGFVLLMVSSALAMNGGYFLAGAASVTAITNTTTAGTFVKLTSSDPRQTDTAGNVYTAQAFEVYELTNQYDLRISFWGSSPAAYVTWKAAWGPFQTWMVPPDGGVYVALTFTPGASDTINIGFDTKR